IFHRPRGGQLCGGNRFARFGQGGSQDDNAHRSAATRSVVPPPITADRPTFTEPFAQFIAILKVRACIFRSWDSRRSCRGRKDPTAIRAIGLFATSRRLTVGAELRR